MSTQFNVGAVSESLPSAGRFVAGSASDPDIQFSVIYSTVTPVREPRSSPGPTDQPRNDPPLPNPCHYPFIPFDEHPSELVETPHWQKDLDDHFTDIFRESVLSECSMDDMATRTLQVIGSPTRTKISGLALAVYTHWARMQVYCRDANVSALEIVTFVSRMVDRLGRMSVHAQRDFLDELNDIYIEKLKLTWRWYVAVVIRKVLPIPRKHLFMRVMAVVAMISHLFHGGQLEYNAVLHSLGYIAMMSPWPDAVAVIYALLHELGPRFALEPAGWQFVQHLLANLLPLTAGRSHSDPLHQLISAINTLVAEWHNTTQVTLYHTNPHSQI